MSAYKEKFVAGSQVQIAAKKVLIDFMRPSWRYHHPLAPEQLPYAGQIATVRDVGFYHGGDRLYHLKDIPGIWHEECLMEVASSSEKRE